MSAPLQISDGARRLFDEVCYERGTTWKERDLQKIQLAINTATQELQQENEGLRVMHKAEMKMRQVAEQRIKELEERVDWLEQQREEECKQKIAALNESAMCLKECDALTQKLAMVEKEGIATAQMLLMLTRQAEKVLPHDSEILNAAKNYFVKRFDNPTTTKESNGNETRR